MTQDTTPIRILVIPHQPNRNIKVRAIEMARHLAAQPHYEVYALTWRSRSRHHLNFWSKVGFKLQEAFESCRIAPKVRLDENIHWVSIPHLLAPYPVCKHFNQLHLQRFIHRHKIQVVISGNAYHFPMPDKHGMFKIYDVVDDHLSPDSGAYWRNTRAFTIDELKKADRVLTVSHSMQGELAELGFSPSTLIPNGIDLAAFKVQHVQAIANIQQRYGLKDCFTIGYFSNHGWWGGLDLLLKAFQKLQDRVPQSRLMIVGSGQDLQQYQTQYADNPNIIFTGSVPPGEVIAYLQASSLGVLPFKPCPFTDNTLPLKILEYGAVQKLVLATPLKELMHLNFPHVRLLEPNVETWGEALIQEALNPTRWDKNWNHTIAEYDWDRLWGPLDKILKSRFGIMDAVTV